MLFRFKRVILRGSLLVMLLSLTGVSVALAASGLLDSAFSGDGREHTDFASSWHDSVYGLAVQSDGKIVAVGERYDPAASASTTTDFALARYNTDGSLDPAFSGDGKQLTDFGGIDWAYDVAIQPSNGKIVVSGLRCRGGICHLALARYNTLGALDSNFNGTGRKIVAFGTGNNGTLGGLAIQSDGKIVVAGFTFNTAENNDDFAVYRLNPDGSMDATFNGDGRASFGFGAGRADRAFDLVLQGSKIVVGGQTCDASHVHCDFALARLTASGTLDSTFSGDGKETTDFGADDHIYGLALQPDGRLVAAGEKLSTSAQYSAALARYNSNGALDTTFNGTGKKLLGFGAPSIANDVLVQSNGKIVVAGQVLGPAGYDFALARLNPDGNLDPTFSGDGRLRIDFANKNDMAYALARQADGKYVLGGQTTIDGQDDFALARVLP